MAEAKNGRRCPECSHKVQAGEVHCKPPEERGAVRVAAWQPSVMGRGKSPKRSRAGIKAANLARTVGV